MPELGKHMGFKDFLIFFIAFVEDEEYGLYITVQKLLHMGAIVAARNFSCEVFFRDEVYLCGQSALVRD